MTNSQARRFLQAIIRDANDALAALADNDYTMAALEVDCLAVDAANVVEGLRELAAEQEAARSCCRGRGCENCVQLDAAEYA